MIVWNFLCSKKPVAVATCEATSLARLRAEQWSETPVKRRKKEIYVLVRNLRSSAYRLALATIVLEHQDEDVESVWIRVGERLYRHLVLSWFCRCSRWVWMKHAAIWSQVSMKSWEVLFQGTPYSGQSPGNFFGRYKIGKRCIGSRDLPSRSDAAGGISFWLAPIRAVIFHPVVYHQVKKLGKYTIYIYIY